MIIVLKTAIKGCISVEDKRNPNPLGIARMTAKSFQKIRIPIFLAIIIETKNPLNDPIV